MDGHSPKVFGARCCVGFTVLELLVSLAVLALLSSLALPVYKGAWLHTRRTEALAVLLRMQLAQEKFFVESGRYATDLMELYASSGTTEALQSYQLSLTSSAADTYWLAATAVGAQSADRAACRLLAVNQRGERSPPEASGCWR
jgi:type IV pilus assembly protein PilE